MCALCRVTNTIYEMATLDAAFMSRRNVDVKAWVKQSTARSIAANTQHQL